MPLYFQSRAVRGSSWEGDKLCWCMCNKLQPRCVLPQPASIVNFYQRLYNCVKADDLSCCVTDHAVAEFQHGTAHMFHDSSLALEDQQWSSNSSSDERNTEEPKASTSGCRPMQETSSPSLQPRIDLDHDSQQIKGEDLVQN